MAPPVWTAPALALLLQGPSDFEIEAAIDRGVAHLLQTQQPDGTWLYQGQPRPGATALVVYALVKSGVPADHAAIQDALARLARQDAEATYDTACLLMALTAVDVEEHWEWIRDLTERLVNTQTGTGVWGYPAGTDLSNTQYAALGLRAAGLAGVDLPGQVWSGLLRGLAGHQEPSGGFVYRRNARPTVSMTAAGVGTLAICDAMLMAGDRLTLETARGLRQRRDEGIAWLAERADAALSIQSGGWTYYRLYGIERVGALVGLTRLGEVDWYDTGARSILAEQMESGGWSDNRQIRRDRGGRLVQLGEAQPAQTAFALLFLRRATRGAITGRYSDRPGNSYAQTDPGADVLLAATGESPLTVWIAGWGAGARERLEWDREAGKGPRVRRVEYLDGDRVIATVEAPQPDRPSGLERFPIRHAFRTAGEHSIRARVHVLAPPGNGTPEGGGLVLAESPPLVVSVQRVIPPWVIEQEADREGNLMARGQPRARASTTYAGGRERPALDCPAGLAVDQRQRTAWLAQPGDERPTLTIDLKKPVTADLILLENARSVPYQAGYFARALEWEVRVNGGPPMRVSMPPEELRKGRLELDSPVRVRSLELRTRWKLAGDSSDALGLAEVELQLR